MNIKLTVAYDGTAYFGFQKQPDFNSVEEELELAIIEAVKHPVKIFMAGRTDKGVHAMGQIVNFFSETSIDIGNLPRVINRYLPDDIAVVGSSYVDDDFHSRYSAKGKFYRYIIYRGKYRNPIFHNRSYHYPFPLDIEKMKEASKCLIGELDFKSFMGRGAVVKDTIRRIYRIEFIEDGDMLYIDFYGKSFLKNMVRILVGTFIEIGTGHRDVDFMENALYSKRRRAAGPTAPACGLYLMKIYY